MTDAVLDELRDAATQGVTDWSPWGRIRQRELGPLVLLNYTHQAAFAREWLPGEVLSRGLILDRRSGDVVARPFDKFFNWGEDGRTSTAPVETVVEKLDGSLGILYRDDDGPCIATRGSFDSDQARWATNWLARHGLDGLDERLTLLFEIVYPDNRIVVDYGQRRELVLLAARDRRTGEYSPHCAVETIARRFGFGLPAIHDAHHPDVLTALCAELPASEEGYVATFADGQRFKFKGDQYKTLHKLVTGLTPRRVLDAMADGNVDAMFEVIPDEFLDEARVWRAEVDAERERIAHAARAILDAAPRGDRKALAMYVNGDPDRAPLAAYVFALADGRDIDPLIYRRAFDGWRKDARKELGPWT